MLFQRLAEAASFRSLSQHLKLMFSHSPLHKINPRDVYGFSEITMVLGGLFFWMNCSKLDGNKADVTCTAAGWFPFPRKGDSVAVWCSFSTDSTNLFSVRRQEIVGTILGGRFYLSSVLCPVGFISVRTHNNELFSRFLLSSPRISQHMDQNENRIDLITRFRSVRRHE